MNYIAQYLLAATVVCLGDSMTNFSGNPAIEWPAYVSAPGVTMRNEAVGGTRINDAVNKAFDVLTESSPELFVVWTGTNDILLDNPTPKELRQRYRNLFRLLKGRKVLWCTIAPRGYSGKQEEVRVKFNTWLKERRGNNVVDLAALLVHPESSRHMRTEYTSDGAHLSQAGKEVVASFIKSSIISITPPK